MPPLDLSPLLSQAAAAKAADMINRNYWSHVSPAGVGPWYWISAAGYRYVYAGENLAQGYNDDFAVIAAWMNSSEHRANLLGANFRDMGCGFASGLLLGVQSTVTVCDLGSAVAQSLSPAAPSVRNTEPGARPGSDPDKVIPTPAVQTSLVRPVPNYFLSSVLHGTHPKNDLKIALWQLIINLHL